MYGHLNKPTDECTNGKAKTTLHTSYVRGIIKDGILTIFNVLISKYLAQSERAQWLNGRVLDSRLKGRGFEPHWSHCVVSLSKTH